MPASIRGANAHSPALARRAQGGLHPALACLLLLAACDPGPTSSPEPPEGGPAAPSLPDRVVFVDRGLRQAVRDAVGRPHGGITREDADSLRDLDASDRGIVSLAGIGQLPDLTSLDISFNHITDIRPLAGLTRLQLLNFEGNGVRDITPLAGLGELRSLVLNGNGLEDLSALRRLPHLTYLEMDDNGLEYRELVALVTVLQASGVRVVGEAAAVEPVDTGGRVALMLDWDDYQLSPGRALAYDGRRALYAAADTASSPRDYVRLMVSEYQTRGWWQKLIASEALDTWSVELRGTLTSLWFDPNYYSLAFAVRSYASSAHLLLSKDGGRSWEMMYYLPPGSVSLTTPAISIRLETDMVPIPGQAGSYLVNTADGLMQTRLGDAWELSYLAPEVGPRDRLASGGRFAYRLAPDAQVWRAEAGTGGPWQWRGAIAGARADHPLALAVSSNDGDRLYAATVGGLYLSLNGGANWNRVLAAVDEPWRAIRIRLSEADPLTVFLVHPVYPSEMWESTNGGVTWQAVGDLFPADPGSHTAGLRLFYDIVADPLDPLQAWVAISSGVYRWFR
ncbi:MAG: leucine-rich repeat domain-containing protein [Gemmatimonadota bacterium]